MKRIQKPALYEAIMKEVGNYTKKLLSESTDSANVMMKARRFTKKLLNETVNELEDWEDADYEEVPEEGDYVEYEDSKIAEIEERLNDLQAQINDIKAQL